jgi:hypothetical protein
MGATVPRDSVASGSITIVEGSSTESGTFRALTRGADQTAEITETSERTETVVHSRGIAANKIGTSVRNLKLELAVSSQSATFPLALLTGIATDSGYVFEYVGLESLQETTAHHIRLWRVFSDSKAKHLEEFSAKDLWIDATTALPCKLAFVRRESAGTEPGVPVEVFFSDYRNVGGVLYPFQIRKSLNGTPWITITIESVALNTGLTDSDFPTR